ncbi:MAG: DUF922 domain-containing protein [Rhizobiales bacterium]|nr:DUF922 domain-containing protein [Hyphomicrobiales bacterium]
MKPAQQRLICGQRSAGAAWRSVAMVFMAAVVSMSVGVAAQAEPQINVEERTYDIEGGSIGALRAQMAERGPFSEKAEGHVPARTEATVDFRFTTRWRRGACRVGKIRVTADVTYIYPNWLNLDEASVRLGDKWVNYIKQLRVHEEGHGQMVFDSAHEVDAMLASMGGLKNCKKLRQRAKSRGEKILRAMAAAQIQYDDDTDGGKTQGAVLREGSQPVLEPHIN